MAKRRLGRIESAVANADKWIKRWFKYSSLREAVLLLFGMVGWLLLFWQGLPRTESNETLQLSIGPVPVSNQKAQFVAVSMTEPAQSRMNTTLLGSIPLEWKNTGTQTIRNLELVLRSNRDWHQERFGTAWEYGNVPEESMSIAGRYTHRMFSFESLSPKSTSRYLIQVMLNKRPQDGPFHMRFSADTLLVDQREPMLISAFGESFDSVHVAIALLGFEATTYEQLKVQVAGYIAQAQEDRRSRYSWWQHVMKLAKENRSQKVVLVHCPGVLRDPPGHFWCEEGDMDVGAYDFRPYRWRDLFR